MAIANSSARWGTSDVVYQTTVGGNRDHFARDLVAGGHPQPYSPLVLGNSRVVVVCRFVIPDQTRDPRDEVVVLAKAIHRWLGSETEG
jgi:hypothetical protein